MNDQNMSLDFIKLENQDDPQQFCNQTMVLSGIT